MEGKKILGPENDRLLPSLESGHKSGRRRSHWNPNPLPWTQLSIVLFNRVCDALAAQSIQPYINQRVGELGIIGGDQRKVGYYVGLIDSVTQAALTLTIFQWNRLSDYIGRKPVLLIGTLGSMLSLLFFGLAQTYLGLIASACLWGFLDSNVGITKSIIGEITDSTNRAKGFGLIFVFWAIGGTIGPIVGGTLARASDRFPTIFGGTFWKQYPYFLPCLVVSLFVAICCVVILLFFEETVPAKSSLFRYQRLEQPSLSGPEEEPLPLRQVFVYPVVVAVSNYMALAFLGTCHSSLFPLFFAMPVEIGGLGFDPARIGYIMGVYRALAAVFMSTVFPRIVHQKGERHVFIIAMSSFPILWALFPVINWFARNFGIGMFVWMWIGFMVVPVTCMDMGYSCIFIFITSAAPNKRSLGATNGISQTSASVARSIAPALATSLFSFSAQHDLLGGYAVYAIFFVLSCFAVILALLLPHRALPSWEAEEKDEDDDDLRIKDIIDVTEIPQHPLTPTFRPVVIEVVRSAQPV